MRQAPPPPDLTEHFAALDRRRFLRLLGGAAALGLLPAGCGDTAPHLDPPAGLALQVFSPREYAVFTAAALRIAGARAAPLIESRRIDPARTADAWAARVPELAGALPKALLLLEFGVPPLVWKLRPFTALGDAEQDRVLGELMGSRLRINRQVFKGIKSLACLTVYAAPASRELTGFPGPGGGAGVRVGDAMDYVPER